MKGVIRHLKGLRLVCANTIYHNSKLLLLYNYLISLDNPWILEVVYKCLKNSTTIISSTFLFLSTNHDSLHIYKKKPSK